MNRRFFGVLAAVLLAGTLVLALVFRDAASARQEFARQAALARAEAGRIRGELLLYSRQRVSAGLTLSQALAGSGAQPLLAASIIDATQGVFDLRQLRAGHSLEIGRSPSGQLLAVRYQVDASRMLSVHAANGAFQAEIDPIPVQLGTLTITGEVNDSLFRAVQDAGADPELAMRLADIFSWDLDFYTDTRRGDTFRVLIEKKSFLDGQEAGYGRILAAEYDNAGHAYQAVLFHDGDGAAAYYSADGTSLQKAFLRSPLKFEAPITSHFSNSRFHPILKEYRPHLGVDYAAPAGTPVQAIGDGRVVFAGHKGGDGNMVEIEHANGYQTMYLHLSAILVRPGQHVEAGGRIGLVGSTGLATGPHLDFRIIDHGVFQNFEVLRQHMPPAQPVARGDLAAFNDVRDQDFARLGEHTFESSADPGTLPQPGSR
jgi:murein DD-endopeptidase MepM/ murein hydrolase activator NlpD